MPFNRYSPLYPLAGYILAILALFTFVLQRLPKFSPGATAGKGWKSNPSIFAVLAVVSLGSTWFCKPAFPCPLDGRTPSLTDRNL